MFTNFPQAGSESWFNQNQQQPSPTKYDETVKYDTYSGYDETVKYDTTSDYDDNELGKLKEPKPIKVKPVKVKPAKPIKLKPVKIVGFKKDNVIIGGGRPTGAIVRYQTTGDNSVAPAAPVIQTKTTDGWKTIFGNLASQTISAFGRNPSQQIASGNIAPVNLPYNYGNEQARNPYGQTSDGQTPVYAPNPKLPESLGGAVGSGIDGIFGWAMQNPLYVFGGIAAIYLLYRQPPGKKG